ncbi:MAG: flagellar hook-length control protein FliK [Desulfobacterium sp.]|nr:flagellar hook-length control protein FliK [Desulfobacterium sp.]
MNLNFVNSGISPDQVVPGSMGAGPTTKGSGRDSDFTARLEALLSGENRQASTLSGLAQGKFQGGFSSKNMEESINTSDGKSVLLPISDLPLIASLLGALQISEQRCTALINDAKKEGVGIDLDRLIKGLQSLQQDAFFAGTQLKLSPGTGGAETRWMEQMFASLGLESRGIDFSSLTLDDLVTALEQKRLFFAGTPGPETGVTSGVKADLDRLMASLEKLEREDPESVPRDLAGFVSLLKDLEGSFGISSGRMSSGVGTSGKIGSEPGVPNGIKTNLDNLLRQIQALEKQSVMPGTDSFESSPSEASGDFDPESLLKRLIAGFSANGEQPGKSGEMTVRVGTGTGENPASFAGIKAVPDPKMTMNPRIHTGGDPDPARLLENVAALVKEMRASADDAKTMGREANHGAGVKETVKGGRAIDAAGVAGGESRQMGMESRGQAVSNQGSPRSPLPSFVANQVGKSLARAVSQGDTEIKLQLRPPELGRILMTIDNRGNSIKVSVITENQAAKEILVAHVNELKATLAGSGIVIGSFDVEMGSDFNHSMADARQHFKGSGSKSARGRRDGPGSDQGENDSNADIGVFPGDDQSLHFVA